MTCNTSGRSRGGVHGACPPMLGKKKKKTEKNAEGRKAGQASKPKPSPSPSLAQGQKLPLNTLTSTILYGKQFKCNDKAIVELEVVVTKCSVYKCLAYHYENNNHIQPLDDMKNCSVLLAYIIYYLHNNVSMLLLPYGEGGKDVLS